jgi:hypothetical protein
MGEGCNSRGTLEQVDSLLEFKSFFFLKEVQENFLSFLSSGDDGSTGHLLSRD